MHHRQKGIPEGLFCAIYHNLAGTKLRQHSKRNLETANTWPKKTATRRIRIRGENLEPEKKRPAIKDATNEEAIY